MYVITFYSFKGGVGRTMAMVNAAAQLVDHGKNVLLVDFDLEAPGLDAFPLLSRAKSVSGLVEYVTDYLNTGRAPLATNYVSACDSLGKRPGRLWVMPSGIRDSTYSSRLQTIDWQTLYSEHNGYLLFEDLKAQWESHLKPDYVLVDSRTGHTDIGGICTRQLPDAVVLCFLPNDENIRGLESVVAEIRQEREAPLQKEIEIVFVPCNVPYLDDEDDILDRRLKDAEKRLGFTGSDAIVHRYDSLALLDCELFSITHPRSRLAKEYEGLATAMTAKNFADRSAALRFLSGDIPNIDQVIPGLAIHKSKLEDIRAAHSHDGEVIHHLGMFMRKLGRSEEARKLLEEAVRLGYSTVEMMLDAADRFHADGNRDAAFASLKDALNDPRATLIELNRAVRLAAQRDISDLEDFVSSPRFRDLPLPWQGVILAQMFLAHDALHLIERTIRSFEPGRMTTAIRSLIMLSLIGQRKFEEAMLVLDNTRPDVSPNNLADLFNYAIAEWGALKHVPVESFQMIVDLTPPGREGLSKNVWQCFAIAHWATGHLDGAYEFLAGAEALAQRDESETFSCWRYLIVPPDQFLSDLRSVRSMIEGAEILPAVFG